MSVVDYFLNSLIKRLQKTQKARKRKRKCKRAFVRKARKPVKPKSLKKKSVSGKRKTAPRKGGTVKRSVKKVTKKSSGTTKTVAAQAKRKSPIKKKKLVPSAKKKTKKKVAKVSKDNKAPKEVCIGEITHFFSRIQVVVLKMTGSISVGDTIHIKGRGIDLVQKVGSLQIESIDVKTARKGQLVGLKVKKAVKVGSKVFKADN